MSGASKVGLALVVCLVIWRVGGWLLKDQRLWCENCFLKLETKMVEEPSENLGGWRWPYLNRVVICPKEIKSCEDVRLVELGDSIRVYGQIKNNKYGNKELVVNNLESVRRVMGLNVWSIVKWIRQFRTRLVDTYKFTLSEPQASLLSGITLGKNEKMPQEFYQALIDTGTVHIVAASGYNVTIVAKVVLSVLLLFVNRKKAIIAAIASVGFYVLLAGAGPAVVRAGIMASLVFVAQALGREYLAGWGLVVSSLLMVLIAPWLLLNVSYQLSVAATAGILYLSPIIAKVISKSKVQMTQKSPELKGFEQIKQGIGVDLGTTLGATIATLPIILIHFGRFSLISPVVNVMVASLVPPLMAVGAGIALLGLVALPLAQIGAWFAWPLLTLFNLVVEWFGKLPWASLGL